MKGAALQRFLMRKQGRHWDDAPVLGFSAEDCSGEAVQLLSGWLLGKHPSAPYNPLIAGAFFRAGYIESWGRGIEKINRECREHGIDPPRYDTGMSGLMLTFQANPEHLIAALGEGGSSSFAGDKDGNEIGEARVETRVETPDRVIELLRVHPRLTLAEVAAQIGKSVSAVERASTKLTSEGRLRRVGPRKGGHWEVLK